MVIGNYVKEILPNIKTKFWILDYWPDPSKPVRVGLVETGDFDPYIKFDMNWDQGIILFQEWQQKQVFIVYHKKD